MFLCVFGLRKKNRKKMNLVFLSRRRRYNNLVFPSAILICQEEEEDIQLHNNLVFPPLLFCHLDQLGFPASKTVICFFVYGLRKKNRKKKKKTMKEVFSPLLSLFGSTLLSYTKKILRENLEKDIYGC